ncbi:hypothetical protein BV898_10979 [Hypsibius exemplaris]|uniref:Uncharacterized protein n=1 Tax=Hypsibius exemplaris TaxID=2072580 RepID=A0A1W0WHY8_HYPEX|nr:hypothetical protein BV898_10979 [Hypsibius exemplaris]
MSNEDLKLAWKETWRTKTPEEIFVLRQRGGMHVHRWSDIMDGSMGYRPIPKAEEPAVHAVEEIPFTARSSDLGRVV